MNEMIKSQALEANLSRTQNIPYTIPEHHQWFMSLSDNYWGIHKRITDFFNEYHHPFSNKKEIVNQLVSVTISDFWLYKELPEENKEKALQIIFDLYQELLQKQLADDLCKQLIYTFLDFFNNAYDTLEGTHFLTDYLTILDQNLEANSFSYYYNVGHFKKKLRKAAENETTASTTVEFMRKLLRGNVQFWEESTQIEAWYEKNRAKMSKDYSQQLNQLGKALYADYYEQIDAATTFDELAKYAFTFADIIEAYKKEIDIFEKASEQFCYIFYLLHLPGVKYHREYLLIELNKVIKRISTELDEEQCIESMNV